MMEIKLKINDFTLSHEASVRVDEFALLRDPASPCGLHMELKNHFGRVKLGLSAFEEIRYTQTSLSMRMSFGRFDGETLKKINEIFGLDLRHEYDRLTVSK